MNLIRIKLVSINEFGFFVWLAIYTNVTLAFCTILTKFNFFIKNRISLILYKMQVKIVIFEKSQESVLQFVLQFIRKIVLKSEK